MKATITLTSTAKDSIGVKRPRKWEKRWVLVPNVLDLNKGEIWVQKWVTTESAKESKEAIKKMIDELELAEK